MWMLMLMFVAAGLGLSALSERRCARTWFRSSS